MKRSIKKTCSNCEFGLEKHRIGFHRYCLKCHAEYMRKNRKRHSQLTKEQHQKANARSYLNTYLKRGKVIAKSCQICGVKAQAHHSDYSKPLDVQWLCRKHHLQYHKHKTHVNSKE